MSDAFIEKACAINCAAIDRQHDADLAAARQMLVDDPGLTGDDIFTAAVCGNAAAVTAFVTQDPDRVNRKGGPRNWTPLLYLCFSRFLRARDARQVERLLATAQVLLEAGADPNTHFMLDDERETALYAACGVCNNPQLARLLIKHGAIVDDDDATYHVAEFPNHECMGVLLDHGLSADHAATMLLRKLDFDDVEGARYLLERGVDVNHAGRWGKTPLHQAIMRGRDLDTIILLVESGADVNARRKDDATPYYLACIHGRRDVASYLAGRGADTELEPADALLAACGLGDAERTRAVVEAYPDLAGSLSESQRSVFSLAGKTGNRGALELMLDCGVDINATGEWGFTALHWAAWYGHVDCVRLLIERGAPLDARNDYGGTVIDSTVWGFANSDGDDRHCREILKLLITAGANVHDVSPFPSGHDEADALLREFGR